MFDNLSILGGLSTSDNSYTGFGLGTSVKKTLLGLPNHTKAKLTFSAYYLGKTHF